MKRFIGVLSVALIIGVIAGPTAAMAGGNGAIATPFVASYTNTYYVTTHLECSGAHVALQKANNTFFKDDESCLITGDTSGFVAGTYTSDPGSYFGNVPPYGNHAFAWASDFPGENGAWATSWTVTISLNPDGSVNFNIDAYYAA